MKIAILCDVHFGVRGDSQIFLDHQKKFFTETFFPYLENNGIKTVLDLGDIFDRRKYINFNTLSTVKSFYFDQLQKNNITLHSVVGNHDTYFKNSNDVNSIDLVLREYDNIITYRTPQEIVLDGLNLLVVPWINPENNDECMSAILDSKSRVVVGHFELGGEKLKGNFEFAHGVTLKDFKRFERVFSGHYHCKMDIGNFKYFGSPYQFDWGDFGDKRGFHIFDTETLEVEFIENQTTLFEKVYWDDIDGEDVIDIDVDESKYKEKFIKVIVKNKANPYVFDKWVEAVEQCGPYSLSIEEIAETLTDEDIDVDQVEDTLTTLKRYINNNVCDSQKKALYSIVEKLYHEALNVE